MKIGVFCFILSLIFVRFKFVWSGGGFETRFCDLIFKRSFGLCKARERIWCNEFEIVYKFQSGVYSECKHRHAQFSHRNMYCAIHSLKIVGVHLIRSIFVFLFNHCSQLITHIIFQFTRLVFLSHNIDLELTSQSK